MQRLAVGSRRRQTLPQCSVQFAATVCDDKVQQRGTYWRVPCVGNFDYFSTAPGRPRQYCQRHMPYDPLCKNMTSSTKLELHNVLHFVRGGYNNIYRSEVWTCVFEICEQTDRQTDIQTLIAIYAVSQKMSHLWFAITFDTCEQILIFFWQKCYR